MSTRLAIIVLCAVLAAGGCATKDFVKEQVTATESKLAEKVTATETSLGTRADAQDTKLRETAERTGENREAITATTQRLEGLDRRVSEVDTAVAGARTQAQEATAATQDAEARLSQRLAGRNRYRVLDTKAVHFDFGKIDIRKQDMATLDEVAKVLLADPNAILELQGFADTQGTDRYNYTLARERVEVVTRYLMQHHKIELRQLHGIAMGKAELAPGEKATPENMAGARRVEMRVLAPWSSWEDRVEGESPSALPAEVHRGDSSGRSRLPAILRDITPQDFGGK